MPKFTNPKSNEDFKKDDRATVFNPVTPDHRTIQDGFTGNVNSGFRVNRDNMSGSVHLVRHV